MFKKLCCLLTEIIDLPPKSFVPKETIEYFKPKIHVEMDNPDKLDTVTEIHIKGWRVDKPLMEVLNLCLPAVDQLNTLKYTLINLYESNQLVILYVNFKKFMVCWT